VVLLGRVAVQVSSRNAAPVKFLHPLARPLTQLVERTELDRCRRTGLGASRDETVPLAVVTERTLVLVPVEGAAGYDAEETGSNAVGAAVEDVGLNIAVVEVVMNKGARRTRLLARCHDAVFADVAHHEPAIFLGRAGNDVQRDPPAGRLAVGRRRWREL